MRGLLLLLLGLCALRTMATNLGGAGGMAAKRALDAMLLLRNA